MTIDVTSSHDGQPGPFELGLGHMNLVKYCSNSLLSRQTTLLPIYPPILSVLVIQYSIIAS